MAAVVVAGSGSEPELRQHVLDALLARGSSDTASPDDFEERRRLRELESRFEPASPLERARFALVLARAQLASGKIREFDRWQSAALEAACSPGVGTHALAEVALALLAIGWERGRELAPELCEIVERSSSRALQAQWAALRARRALAHCRLDDALGLIAQASNCLGASTDRSDRAAHGVAFAAALIARESGEAIHGARALHAHLGAWHPAVRARIAAELELASLIFEGAGRSRRQFHAGEETTGDDAVLALRALAADCLGERLYAQDTLATLRRRAIEPRPTLGELFDEALVLLALARAGMPIEERRSKYTSVRLAFPGKALGLLAGYETVISARLVSVASLSPFLERLRSVSSGARETEARATEPAGSASFPATRAHRRPV